MSNRYLFLDLETTGLDPKSDQILEVGAIAVNGQFEVVDTFHAFVGITQRSEEHLNDYVRELHTNNGLLAACRLLRTTCKDVERDLVDWLVKTYPDNKDSKPILAGHSKHFDLGFLLEDMPKVVELLSHRLLDTGAFARFMRDISVDAPNYQDGGHRALDECKAELQEAQILRGLLTNMCIALHESPRMAKFQASESPVHKSQLMTGEFIKADPV